jgi:hypothetical protein
MHEDQNDMDGIKQLEEYAKSGEGSRGGKVIGHTSSGKPVYESHGHAEHKHFSSQDHRDASQIHEKKLAALRAKATERHRAKNGGNPNEGDIRENMSPEERQRADHHHEHGNEHGWSGDKKKVKEKVGGAVKKVKEVFAGKKAKKGGDSFEELEEFSKAKYKKRWRGADGKWKYAYDEPDTEKYKRGTFKIKTNPKLTGGKTEDERSGFISGYIGIHKNVDTYAGKTHPRYDVTHIPSGMMAGYSHTLAGAKLVAEAVKHAVSGDVAPKPNEVYGKYVRHYADAVNSGESREFLTWLKEEQILTASERIKLGKSMDGIEQLEEFAKAKYKSRKRGKDGKYVYTYDEPKGRTSGKAGDDGKPQSMYDELPKMLRPFDWATPAPNIDGSIPKPWRVPHADRATQWLKDKFPAIDREFSIKVDYDTGQLRGKEKLAVFLQMNRDTKAANKAKAEIAKKLKGEANVVLKERQDGGGSWLNIVDDIKRDHLRIKKSLNPIEEIEEFAKAKYTRRWKGPDGKYRYEYERPKGKKEAKQEAQTSLEAKHLPTLRKLVNGKMDIHETSLSDRAEMREIGWVKRNASGSSYVTKKGKEAVKYGAGNANAITGQRPSKLAMERRTLHDHYIRTWGHRDIDSLSPKEKMQHDADWQEYKDVTAKIEQEQRNRKTEKSMDGIEELKAFSKSVQEMPTGNPKQNMGTGSEQGGPLAGVGKTSGDGTSGGEQAGAKKPPVDILSEDDELDEKQMKTHKKPIETKKAMTPATQREMVAQEHAAKASKLEKGEADVAPEIPREPVEEAPKEIRKSKRYVQGNGAKVLYSNEADLAIEEFQKGDGFYHGGSPTLGPAASPLMKSAKCANCETQFSKALSACPECGSGSVVPEVRAVRARVDESGKSPVLRPAQGTPDLDLQSGLALNDKE